MSIGKINHEAGVNTARSAYNPAAMQPREAKQSETRDKVSKPGDYVNPQATDNELRDKGYSYMDIKDLKRTGKVRCETCSNRKYTDGSNDPGVSFKTPTKLSPSQAATAVASHENEHVVRNNAKAQRDGNVARSSVRLFTSVCPECGISYVSGGETRTTTKKKAESKEFAGKYFGKKIAKGIGGNVDELVG